MNVPENLEYSTDHAWILARGENTIRAGITDHGQMQLGDIVFVRLPEFGEQFAHGDTFGSVESGKAAVDIAMPIAGRVIAVNDEVDHEPGLLNSDPYEQGWLIEIAHDGASLDALMNAQQYEAHLDR